MDKVKAEEVCICPECPTYESCDGEMPAFCLCESGHSACITAERGCICGGCPVHAEEGFVYGYYCTRGSEAAQG
jgi:hypothetical protein